MDEIKEAYNIDIKENYVKHLDDALLSILLKDCSSGKNIIWATDTYARYGAGFGCQDYITQAQITGERGCVIKPRTEKSIEEQQQRIKKKAEVFTPSWICNKQNNLIDNVWFGRENVFNTETENGWTVNADKIIFPDGKTWQDYVRVKRLEITCGEAPYLTSRYDAVSGEYIEVNNRIGLLDRKLRVVSENANNEQEWVEWALTAYKSVYGFDYQGDNVLIARENLLFAFFEAYLEKFGAPPINTYLLEVAKILSWNIWQMDGLKFVIPESCHTQQSAQLSIFDADSEKNTPCEGCKKNNPRKHTGIYCKIMDWQTGESVEFVSFAEKQKQIFCNGEKNETDFDAIVGNPPYQRLTGGAQAQATPLYHLFVEFAKKISPNYISMIMPSRWFTGGFGLDAFRKRMLGDDQLSIIHDFSKASECFSNVEIKGGVCYLLWEKGHHGDCRVVTHKNGKAVSCAVRPLLEEGNNVFIRHNEAISILRKVKALKEEGFAELVSSQRPFGLPTNFKEYSAAKSDSRDITVYGNKFIGYLPSDFKLTKGQELLNEYKLFTPKAVGAGRTDDVLKPILASPNSVCTETYVAIGPFKTETEEKNAMTYINTKLFHFLLTLKKNTQDCLARAFIFIPKQDFSKAWTDDELYEKYSIDDDEILIIEKTVNKKVGAKHEFK